MFSLKNIFKRKRTKPLPYMSKRKREPVKEIPLSKRRWDRVAHESNAQNKWFGGEGQSINNDLQADLYGLMADCSQEMALNPIFEGIVKTFCDDVVGSNGPMLQVVSDDEAFNNEVERNWKNVFSFPDPRNKNMTGVQSAKQWVRMLLTAGSFINVFTSPRRAGSVSFGWKSVHPRRLKTPHEHVADESVAFGIRLDSDGIPTTYYIEKPKKLQSFALKQEYNQLSAHQVQHRFIAIEPEQITGFPMLASTLSAASDIRKLDFAEIKAQRRAAANSLGLQAVNPELVLDPQPIDTDTIEFSDDAINVAPQGWGWQQLDANRPSPEHISYRRERIAEIGRPIGMPLLVILLTVSDTNFSAAQFGGMLYSDSIKNIQSFIEKTTLTELLEFVITEIVLSSGGKITRPKEYSFTWTHNVPPNANLEKFAKTLRILVEDGHISRSQATAWLGYDPEKVLKAREKDNENADKHSVSPPPINVGKQPKVEAENNTTKNNGVEANA